MQSFSYWTTKEVPCLLIFGIRRQAVFLHSCLSSKQNPTLSYLNSHLFKGRRRRQFGGKHQGMHQWRVQSETLLDVPFHHYFPQARNWWGVGGVLHPSFFPLNPTWLPGKRERWHVVPNWLTGYAWHRDGEGSITSEAAQGLPHPAASKRCVSVRSQRSPFSVCKQAHLSIQT